MKIDFEFFFPLKIKWDELAFEEYRSPDLNGGGVKEFHFVQNEYLNALPMQHSIVCWWPRPCTRASVRAKQRIQFHVVN